MCLSFTLSVFMVSSSPGVSQTRVSSFPKGAPYRDLSSSRRLLKLNSRQSTSTPPASMLVASNMVLIVRSSSLDWVINFSRASSWRGLSSPNVLSLIIPA